MIVSSLQIRRKTTCIGHQKTVLSIYKQKHKYAPPPPLRKEEEEQTTNTSSQAKKQCGSLRM